MTSSYNDCLSDFDLNYLDQAPEDPVVVNRTDRHRKDILKVKTKIIATHSVIDKYKIQRKALTETEHALLSAREESKKICIDYKNTLDKCSKLEMDLQSSLKEKRELKARLSCSQNQYEAIQVHTNQLQQLVKEYETRMEALNIESQLEKMNLKNYQTQITRLKNENEILKKKLTLKNETPTPELKKNYNNNNEDSLSGEDFENSGDEETDIFDNLGRSPPLRNNFTENNNEQISTSLQHNGSNKQENMKTTSNDKKHQGLTEDDIDRQSNSSHGMASIDTGRGSSLAISDSDKCFDSPDYVNNYSPLDSGIAMDELKTKHVSVSTSPLTVNTTVDRGLSPINFETINPSVSLNIMSKKCTVNVAVMTDRVSPVKILKDVSTSPGKEKSSRKVVTTPVKPFKDVSTSPTSKRSLNEQKDKHAEPQMEKQCLELNNSVNMSKDEGGDYEIINILREMKFTRQLITPIPTTPAQSNGSHEENSANADLSCSHDPIMKKILETVRKECLSYIGEQNKKISRIEELLLQQGLNKAHTEAPSDNIENICVHSSASEVSISCPENISDAQNNICDDNTIPDIDHDIEASHEFTEDQDHHTSPSTKLDSITELENNVQQLSTENNTISSTKRSPRVKRKKLTRLDKFKNKMLPKSKIMKATKLPSKLLQIKLKPISQNIINNFGDSAASINNKTVYENAVRVMAELNAKKRAAKSLLDEAHTINTEVKNVKNQITNEDKEIENMCIVTRSRKSREKEIILSPSAQIETQSQKSRESGEKEIIMQPSAQIETQSQKSRESGEKEIIMQPSAKIETRSRKSRESGEKEIILSPSAKIETRSRKSRESGEIEIILSPSAQIETQSRKSRESGEKERILSPSAKIGTRSRKSRESGEKEIILSPSAQIETQSRKSRESGEKERILSPSAKIETRSRKSTEIVEKEIILSPSAKIGNRSRKSRESGEKEIIWSPSAKIETRSRKSTESGEKEIFLSPSAKIGTRSRKSRESGEKEIILSPSAKIETRSRKSRESEEKEIILSPSAKIGTRSRKSRESGEKEIILSPSAKIETRSRKSRESAEKEIILSPSAKIETRSRKSRESAEKEIILSPSAKIETRSRKSRESAEKEIILSPSAKIETRSRKSRESGEKEIILSPPAKIENPNSRKSENTKLDNNINNIGATRDCTQNDSEKEDKDATKPYDETETQIVKEKRKAIKRLSVEKIETPSKRILRSSTIVNSLNINAVNKKLDFGDGNIENRQEQNSTILQSTDNFYTNKSYCNDAIIKTRSSKIMSQSVNERRVDYADLDLFNDKSQKNTCNNEIHSSLEQLNVEKNPEDNILCTMLQKYFITSVKYPRKISDSVINNISTKIEGSLKKIIESPKNETKLGMDKFVEDVRHLNSKHFIAGLMKYLIDPTRKAELFNKVECRPAPPMTKSEQILIYVLSQLKTNWPGEDIIDNLLKNIEYTLFRINRTPEFNVIEAVSHFYAVLCRYTQAKCRLRLFILDAMYCIQYKAIPLIKQCLDVWAHILPLAHMGIAKSPLVTSMVYLLHFFKCEDKFNRVNEIRKILSQRYFFVITEWTEPRILEMFKSSIKDMRDIYIEKKMLRLALIILAKRHGPRWCQANIIKNMLQPMIENKNTPERIKVFCVSMIGPLMKPFPVDMKVHCEIVINQLIDMLQKEPSLPMQEAIYSSLILLSKHNQNKVIQVLLTWNPKQISPAMELTLKDYVREKPFKVWKGLLSKTSLN